MAKSSVKKTGKVKTKSSPKPVARKQAAVKTKKPTIAVVKPAPVVAKPTKASKVEKPSKKTPPIKPIKPIKSAKPVKPVKNISEKPGSVGSDRKLPKIAMAASPLKTKDLLFFRDLLVQKRHELLGDVDSMEQEALRSTTGSNLSNLPIHMADMGTDNYEQEFTLGLVEKDRQMLREINMALEKIKTGTYGVCEGTGKPISRARLEAKPWARYSLEYMMKLEKGLVRR